MSKDRINYDQLLEYIVTFDSQAVIKRLGYLLELLSIVTPIIDNLQKMRSDSIIILDTVAPKQGTIMSRWSIQQNVDIETIKKAITT
jgi:predicted transcriptional regulator of viral defense system